MAITVIRHYETEETAGEEVKDRTLVRNYTMTWQARCTANETAAQVLLSSELRSEATMIFAGDAAARRVSLQVSKTNGLGEDIVWYLCSAEYTTDKNKINTSPLYPDTPAVIGYSWERRPLAVDRDLDDKPIVNTAQDPFAEPLTIEDKIRVKTIQVNLSPEDFDVSVAEAYDRCVNSDTYDGYGPGEALLDDITAQQVYYVDDDEDEQMMWAVQIKISFNRQKWNPVKKLSAGYNELNADGDKQRILLPSGEEACNPVPLNEDGEAVFGDDVETDAHYIEFNMYQSASFAPFVF